MSGIRQQLGKVLCVVAASATLAAFAGEAAALDIFRGSKSKAASSRPQAGSAVAPEMAVASDGVIVAAGERLWIYDSVEGSVRSCALRKTTQVSGYRVRCYR